MKIAFITGSLEPGRDGVGDYTRGLAAECIRQGHSSFIVAMNDTHISDVWSGSQEMDGISIPVLRLPWSESWADRGMLAFKWLEDFKLDWVSLQFVCYAFHPKGLVHGLAQKLAPLCNGRKLHLMFHEIWLCKELGWGWRQSLVGAFQRHFIHSFVRKTQPAVVHTSNVFYAAFLNQNAIPATQLGLFGNVPVVSQPGAAWLEAQLRQALGDDYRREDVWLFGFFGALHAQWPPEPLLGQLRRAAQAARQRPVILSIGRIGHPGLSLWNRIAGEYADDFAFLRFGEQPVERISEYLAYLDFGIATTPRSIIGKSGTVVSMLEHGLPVIVNRDDAPGVHGPSDNGEPLLLAGDKNLEARLAAGVQKGPRGSRRPQITRHFLSSLGVSGSSV